MPINVEEIWAFLVENGIRRIRYINGTFEFLTMMDQILTEKSLHSRFVASINSKRPQMRRRDGRVTGRTLRFKLDLETLQMRKESWSYLSLEDLKKDKELDVALKRGREIFRELTLYLNRVKFGETRLPEGDLASYLNSSNLNSDENEVNAVAKIEILRRLINSHYPNLRKHETVPGSVRANLRRLLGENGVTVTMGTLRTYLMRMDYSKPQNNRS